MDFSELESRGLVLLGCGKMGSALLKGWLSEGMNPSSVWIIDPYPSDWVQTLDGVHVNAGTPTHPALVVLAVKPQMMGAAAPTLAEFGNGSTVFLSIAAGVPISQFEHIFGADTPIIRAMPNTPAAVGHGISALIGNAKVNASAMDMAEGLLQSVGQTIRLEDEAQMDAVTAVSGSGPAYVFHLIETLAAAGEAEGLSPDVSMALARATVAGAGDLAENAEEDPSQLRVNVTSPAGTTAAALEVLMDPDAGFPQLLKRAVAAAANRSRELGS